MSLSIEENVSLAPYTTLKVGGTARYFVKVTDNEALKEALRFAKHNTEKEPLIIGVGSNILFRDAGYDGLVIMISNRGCEYKEQDETLTATFAAGEILDEVVADTGARGWWGLENLSSIPGTIGATPVQNVGAYGVEVADLIENVVAINTETYEERNFSTVACDFSYRDSFFKSKEGRKWVIVSVTMKLSKQARPTLNYPDIAHLSEKQHITPQIVREVVTAVRAQKFPDWQQVGTAGSFFKNPVVSTTEYKQLQALHPSLPGYEHEGNIKVPLGYVLDKVCGLKGYTEGNVGLYENQALVLVATKGATAAEVEAFVKFIIRTVLEKTNINIEPEVRLV